MSATDREDTFVLVGRNPDIESVGPDYAADYVVNDDVSSPAESSRAVTPESSSNYPLLTTKTSELTSDPASRLLEAYFKSAPVPLHLLSRSGIIIWANDSELQLVGYTADEYIGHEINEVKIKIKLLS